jgi:hypothetical protein
VNLSKVATALALSVALAATLAAAPQASKATTPAKAAAKSTEQKAEKKAPAMKAEMVKPADLPKAVTDAVMKAHPKGTIASATKGMRGTDTVFNVKVSDAGKTSTMVLKEDGTMPAPAAKKGKGK